MEIYDFIWFLLMIGFISVPFCAVYFILYTLKWNERESLFSDSWAVFLAWLVSSILAFFISIVIERNSYSISGYNLYKLLVPLVIVFNIISIAVILTLKVREREKRLSVTDNFDNEKIRKTDNKKIWQTSVIVSILVFAAVVSLGVFVNDILERIEKLNPKPKVEFGIYDI